MFYVLIFIFIFLIGFIFSSDEPELSKEPKLSKLEKNFDRLSKHLNLNKNSKKIAVIGQPGSGKSTLIEALTNKKCSPLPKIGPETDATNWNKETEPNFFNRYNNIDFIDVPGYGTTKHPVKSYLKHFPFTKFDNIIFMIKDKITADDEKIFRKLKKSTYQNKSKRLLVVRSFSGDLKKGQKSEITKDLRDKLKFSEQEINLIFAEAKCKTGYKQIKSTFDIC